MLDYVFKDENIDKALNLIERRDVILFVSLTFIETWEINVDGA